MNQLLSLALGMALLAVSGPSRAQSGGDGTDPCSDDCPLVWSHALEDSNVECVDELPTTCEEFLAYASAEGLVAQNACTGQVIDLAACFPLASESESLPVSVCVATTAKRNAELGEGEYDATDGALRLYGLSAMGLADSDYFVEDPSSPLQLVHASDSRSARLTGTVHCVLNPNQIFHVDARFVEEDNASDWLAENSNHTLLIADDPEQAGYQTCTIDTSAISVFDMQVMSRLTGAGEFDGTLFIDHMPMSYSKRFQLGEGANNHNCNYGFGGWFRWEGELNGQDVSGLSGDIVLDLACTENDADCDEYAQFLFEAIDDCGRILSQTVTVEREDVTAPTILDGPADVTVECDAVPAMEGPDSILASDNCEGDLDISEGVEIRYDGPCLQTYTLERRWTVTDACGNSSVHVQLVSVQDTTAPGLVIPSDYTAECSDEIVFGEASVSDNCSETTLEVVEDVLSGDCTGNYIITRTFTATDECGNSTTATQTIAIQDTTAPEFTSVPADYTAECSDEMPMDEAAASDNCGPVSMEVHVETSPGLCAGDYILTRTFTATDDCGNSSSATQTITVQDTTAPALTVPLDYTVECSDEMPMDEATASDNCGEVSLSETQEVVAGACAGSYTIHRSFAAADDCGNVSYGVQTITVVDTTAPEFTSVPDDYTVECSDDMPLDDAQASDNCSGVTVSIETETTAGDCAGNYTVTRTFTATDDCGNSATAIQTITVQDTTAPELVIPADYTAECDEELVFDDASATDNCGTVSIALEEVIIGTDCPQTYTIERTFAATDDCGNTSSATQTILVQDTTAPVVDGALEVMIACEDYSSLQPHASASDNCGEVTLTWEDSQVSGGCVLPVGQYIRLYTAVDECANTSTFEQILTLTDEVAPVFEDVPASYTAECFEELTYGTASASDNCSGVELSLQVDTLWSDCAATYDIVRTWTAVDNCDNVATAVQTISVVDSEGPWFTFVPEDYTAECSEELVFEMATAEDHCSEFTLEVSTDTLAGPCTGQFVILREFIATDACGNVSETTQVISVQDTTAPEFSFVPSDYTAECDDEHPMLDAEATDACGTVSMSYDEDTSYNGCYSSYTVTRTWTATDDCGNSSSASQVITVVDTTGPEFTHVPESYSLECTEDVTYEDATAQDNCAGMTLVLVVDTVFSECENVFDIVRTWTATDGCGNASTASQVVSVVDTTAPQILNTCGLMNQEVIEVCCEALDGSVTVPEACGISFEDNCGQEASLELIETFNGEFAPTESVDRWCVITQPEALADGEMCDGFAPHGMHLFNFPGGDFYNTLNGTVAHNVDGTMTYTMEMASTSNPEAGWTVVTEFTAPMSWTEWVAQPGAHSYKSDCGLGDHTTWDYAMMTSGQATGWGAFEGDSFAMLHQPANGYFGFQIGEGANNKNANYGFSGWFYLSGTVGGQTVNSSGDLFGELDCCQPWTLERAYTVTDCSGNATTFTYEVHATGVGCEAEDEGGISEGEDTSLAIPKDMIQLLDIQPNPSNGVVQFQLLAEEVGAEVEVNLVSMTGEDVLAIYEGMVWQGIAQTVIFDVANVDAGMYQIRLTTKNFMTTKKLLVVH